MPEYLFTTRDPKLDLLLDSYEQRIRALETKAAAVYSNPAVSSLVVPEASGQLLVQLSDGSVALSVQGLEFLVGDGFGLSQDAANGYALVSLAAILKSLVDAKGDLIAGTANDAVARLAVGSDGQVLVADSGQATGLNWGTLTAGLSNNLQKVTGNTTLTSSTTVMYRCQINTAGVLDLTLPNPTTHTQPIFIFCFASGGGNSTIKRNGSESIDGTAADLSINTPNAAGRFCGVGLMSDGTNWFSFFKTFG